MKKIALILLLFSLSALNAAQRERPDFLLGFYAAYNSNIHTASFDTLPPCPSCAPKYKSGSGGGFSIGALFEKPLDDKISISVRAGYASIGAELTREETIGNWLDTITTPAVLEAKSEHLIDSKLEIISFEPRFNFFAFENFRFSGGFRLAYLMTATFDQYEKLVEPEGVVFKEEESRIRNEFSDVEIENANALQFFGVFGMGYRLYLSDNLILEPELNYYLPFTDVSEVTWKPGTLAMGAALKIPFYPSKELPIIEEEIIRRDTTVIAKFGLEEESINLVDRSEETVRENKDDAIIERKIITELYRKEIRRESSVEVDLTVIGKDQSGKLQENPTIIIEETEVEEGFPILPHIFFKEGDSDLSKTDMKTLSPDETDDFDESALPWRALEIYESLLNIIGSRMRNNPDAEIRITGTNKNVGAEENNLVLSRERAEAVKQYLTSVWKIDSDRIAIKARNLPANPGRPTLDDGKEENMRAEISSNSEEILEPIQLKEIMKKSNPPTVEISAEIASDAPLASWNMQIEQNGKIIRDYKGDNRARIINWNVEDPPIPEFEAPLNINFSATDESGATGDANKQVEIKQLTIKKKRFERREDKRIEKYSLILFEYDKAELSDKQKNLLFAVKQRIKPDSKVTIAGYADRTGEPEYNRELARRRCENTQKILQVDESQLTILPIGSDALLFNNDLPQGRGYSRTVQIVIVTPIEGNE